MKILLLNPPNHASMSGGIGQPLGLLLLAGVLLQNRIDTEILDAGVNNYSPEKVVSLIHKKKPEILGITLSTPTANTSLKIAEAIKNFLPKTKIVLGGIHATIFADKLIKFPFVDAVIKGEGEEAIIDVVKGKTGVIDGGLININNLPIPAWELINLKKYKNSLCSGKFAMVMCSRGCPYNCTFCSSHIMVGKKLRLRRVTQLAKELNYLQMMGVKTILFEDDTFTLDRKWVFELCELLSTWKNLGIDGWWCNTRVNLVDEELLQAMKEAGCIGICLGIESGDQEILDKMEKGITLKQVSDGVRMINDAEIETYGYFMIGNLDDTNETIERTIEFAKGLPLNYAQFSICTPFPACELYKIAQSRGIISQNPDWNMYDWEGEPPNVSKVSLEERRMWYKKAIKKFYFRPSQMIKHISWRGLKAGMRLLKRW